MEPVHGHGQVDAALHLDVLAEGDRLWVLVDGAPPRWHQVEVVAVEPILGQTRYQAWIVGRYGNDVYQFRVRATITDDEPTPPRRPAPPARGRTRPGTRPPPRRG